MKAPCLPHYRHVVIIILVDFIPVDENKTDAVGWQIYDGHQKHIQIKISSKTGHSEAQAVEQHGENNPEERFMTVDSKISDENVNDDD